MNSNPLMILLVEDNPDHVFLARKAILREMGADAVVEHVVSAEDAMEFLYQRGAYADADRPDLILMDVQLPGRDGFWVVKSLKSEPSLRAIPIVIFTSSDAESDIRKGYECGTNIYVCKPTGPDEFATTLQAIPAFWSRIAHLPSRDAGGV